MTRASLRGLVRETGAIVRAIEEELPSSTVGGIVVSGMLADALVRELAVGADPGAVTVGGAAPLAGAEVLVHVIAGDPNPEDEALVRDAERAGVPAVLVQIWPQADWKPPYVLCPFVVECRAGEGFPVQEIARRIAEAAERAPALASRVPALRNAVAGAVVRSAAVRAGIVGAAGKRLGASRPLISLVQARMLLRLRAAQGARADPDPTPGITWAALALIPAGFVLREVARAARGELPAPAVNAAVAGAGTWVLGEAFRRLPEHRVPDSAP